MLTRVNSILLFTGMVLFVPSSIWSQNVGINDNGAVPNSYAILDIDASTNNMGILIPRITTGQRTGIGGLGLTEEGLTVYDETTNSYWLWDGIQWVQFMMQGNAWEIVGNAGTNPATNFLGTTDAQDFVIRTNNTERIRVYASGRTEFPMTMDASGTVNSGVIEIGNALRLDDNEVITNTNSPLYINWDNNGDVGMDGGTFYVDASANWIGIGTLTPSTTLDVNGTVRIRGGGPTAGDVLMSTDALGNATWASDGYGMVPIGSILAWNGDMAGVPALPVGWIECVGGTVVDAASPMNGQAIPNLNNATTSRSGDASRGRFLRGHTISGLTQTDESNNFQQYHQDDDDGGPNNVTETLDDDGQWTQYMSDYNLTNRMRFRMAGVETRVTNYSVRWIMRIK